MVSEGSQGTQVYDSPQQAHSASHFNSRKQKDEASLGLLLVPGTKSPRSPTGKSEREVTSQREERRKTAGGKRK